MTHKTARLLYLTLSMLIMVVVQSCMHDSELIPLPSSNLAIDKAKNWFQEVTPQLSTGISPWWTKHIDWDNASVRTGVESKLTLVPIKDVRTRLEGTAMRADRRLVIEETSLGQTEGYIIELYAKVGQLPTGSSAEQVYQTVLHNVHYGKPAQVSNFSGMAVVYRHNYRYLTGNVYSEGLTTGTYRLHVSNKRFDNSKLNDKRLLSTSANRTTCNPGLNCDEYCGSVSTPGGGSHTDCITECYVNPTQPVNPGGYPPGDPSDPGQGGNGGYGGTGPTTPINPTSPPTSSNPNSPCGQMLNLGNQYGFISAMGGLANYTTLSYELGYTFQDGGNMLSSYTGLQGTAGSASIGFSVHFPIDGYIHTHYAGLLSVFSGADLQAMYQILDRGFMINPNTFTVGLVTASGTAYTLKIEDLAAFQAFGSTYLTGAGFNLFETMYGTLYAINPSQSNAYNEQRFLQLLQATNSGLALFKGNPNNFTINTWTRMRLDASNNPTPVPCP